MTRRLAQYRIRDGEDADVLEAIRPFVAAVRAQEPGTTYEAYRLGDGPDFVHLMAFPDAAAEERHRQAPYTARFVAALYPRCETPPVFSELVGIGPSPRSEGWRQVPRPRLRRG